jgi:hypothetical protein
MYRRLKSAILVLSVVVGWQSPARAQLKDNLEINFFGGGSAYSQKKFQIGFPQSTTPVLGAFRLTKAVRGGIRVGVYTHGHWSEELFYSYEPSTAQFIRRSPLALGQKCCPSVNLRLGINNYGATGLYYFQESESHTIRPFLSIGVGGTFYRFTPEALAYAHDPNGGNIPVTYSNLLTMNYGVGVKTRSAGWLGFRADVQGILGPSPKFGLPRTSNDPNAQVFPAGGVLSNASATAGIIIYFSKRP